MNEGNAKKSMFLTHFPDFTSINTTMLETIQMYSYKVCIYTRSNVLDIFVQQTVSGSLSPLVAHVQMALTADRSVRNQDGRPVKKKKCYPSSTLLAFAKCRERRLSDFLLSFSALVNSNMFLYFSCKLASKIIKQNNIINGCLYFFDSILIYKYTVCKKKVKFLTHQIEIYTYERCHTKSSVSLLLLQLLYSWCRAS